MENTYPTSLGTSGAGRGFLYQLGSAGICGQLVCQAVEQRCLARAVGAHERDLVAAVHGEVEASYTALSP